MCPRFWSLRNVGILSYMEFCMKLEMKAVFLIYDGEDFSIDYYITIFQQISDALSVLKYEVNNKKVNVLRPLGEGGYSQVYEVYDQVWITGLKYSCTHNYKFDSRIRPFML